MGFFVFVKRTLVYTCLFFSIFCLTTLNTSFLLGASSVCGRVSLEITQSVSLERAAFDALLKVSNSSTDTSLDEVSVEVNFSDEEGNPVLATSDPNNTNASFFIDIDSMNGISNVDGTGVILPDSVAEVHWLIIPAPGASKGLANGTLYYVGATLAYEINSVENVTEVAPDFIYIKPMPELTIDYFLPEHVYGDDPFTDEIEPETPFSLGVRVKNTGGGIARRVKIESAQLKITDNEQGLLMDFTIIGSEVNNQVGTKSLLTDFGNIGTDSAGMARWIMTCSLSGQFAEFDAGFVHDDAMGGQLTSLISSVNTRTLVHDVLVDFADRDNIRDFLAIAGDELTAYESNTFNTSVENHSAVATFTYKNSNGSEATYELSFPSSENLCYVKLEDPFGGQKHIRGALRSDGKRLAEDNIWFSKTKVDSQWQYYLHVFDSGSTGSYEITFDDSSALPQAPTLQFVADSYTVTGQQMSFLVEASDANGDAITLSALPLPVGATFVDSGNGTAIFDWTPTVGQSGIYQIEFTASDGVLSTKRVATFTVYSDNDSDMDGMPDDWEMEHFGILDRDGTGDFDNDGIRDLDEFLRGLDPTMANFTDHWTLKESVSVNSNWKTVILTDTYEAPVVIASIPTNNDSDFGAVRLSNVSHGRFDIQFAEFDYLDGTHGEEKISCLVVPSGRQEQEDGTITEAGTFGISDTGVFATQAFSESFINKPNLFLTIQTSNDLQVVSLRAKDITTNGFSAALYEQEAFMNGHGLETIGYLAVSTPATGSTTHGSNVTTGVVNISGVHEPILLASKTLTGDWAMYDGITSLSLLEEESADPELEHQLETVNLLHIGNDIFGLQVSSNDEETCVLRVSYTDSDGDGLNDAWEQQFFASLDQGPLDDSDNDGLSNIDEYNGYTYPDLADSDSDQMDDGWEVAYGLNPIDGNDGALDLDGDGISNVDEFLGGFDPTIPAPPVFSLIATPDVCYAPASITFTAATSGNITLYSWDFGDSSPLSSETTPVHTFTLPGTYVISLIIEGPGGTNSASTSVLVEEEVIVVVTKLLIADAGPDQTILIEEDWQNGGATDDERKVNLSGLNSHALEGSIASYEWLQTAGPDVSLTITEPGKAWFPAPVDIDSDGVSLSFLLTVTNDEGGTATDTVIVNVTWDNKAPKASAGGDQISIAGETIILDGSASNDPDGSISLWSWSQASGPFVTLSETNVAEPSFVIPSDILEPASIFFELTVTDDKGLKATDYVIVNIVIDSVPPSVNAGCDQTVRGGTPVFLKGKTNCANGTYRWRQLTGLPVTLSGPTILNPSYTSDGILKDTIFTFELLVTDEDGLTGRDEVEINELACFIATAAYKSPLGPQVTALRQFRDRFLLPNPLGKRFVSAYYHYSPPLANIISTSPGARFITRACLYPVVLISLVAVKYGALPAFILMFLEFFFFIVLTQCLYRVLGYYLAKAWAEIKASKKERLAIAVIFVLLFSAIGTARAAIDKSPPSGTEIPEVVSEARRSLLFHNPEKVNFATIVSAKELKTALEGENPPVLIDVRRESDFNACRIPLSINIPAFAIRTRMSLKDKPVVLINEGYNFHRLNKRLEQLEKVGFKNVKILAGGIVGWQQSGGKIAGDIFTAKGYANVRAEEFFFNRNYENIRIFELHSKQNAAKENNIEEIFPQAMLIPLMTKHLEKESFVVANLVNRLSDNTLYTLIVCDNGILKDNKAGFIAKVDGPVFFLDGGKAKYAAFIEDQLKIWACAGFIAGKGCPTCP